MFDIINSGDHQNLHYRLSLLSEEDRLLEFYKKDLNGRTLLHAAIEKSSLLLIHTLLEWGFPFMLKDNNGKSSLLLAVESGRLEILRELLAWDISLLEADGKQALKFAEESALKLNAPFDKISAFLRAMSNWQSKFNQFKFNRIFSFIQKTSESLNSNEGLDKILFIGSTGSGKSTLINYLSGSHYQIQFSDDSAKPIVKCIFGNEIVKVTHGMTTNATSTTQQLISTHDAIPGAVYCDLRAISDVGDINEQIIAAHNLQLLAQSRGNIKGVVVVLDIPDFNASRGENFKKIAILLSKIIQNNPSIMESICFAITKLPKPDIKVESFINTYIKPVLTSLRSLERRQGKLEGETEALDFMLKQMESKSNRDKIIMMNIEDKGESRQNLQQILIRFKPWHSSHFNFSNYDSLQKNFIESFSSVCDELSKTIDNKIAILPSKISDLETKHYEVERKITSLYKSINKLATDKKSNLENIKLLDNKLLQIQLGQKVYWSSDAKNRDVIGSERDKATYQKNNTAIDISFEKIQAEIAAAQKLSNVFSAELQNLKSQLNRIGTEIDVAQSTLDLFYSASKSLALEYNEKINYFQKRYEFNNSLILKKKLDEEYAAMSRYKVNMDRQQSIELMPTYKPVIQYSRPNSSQRQSLSIQNQTPRVQNQSLSTRTQTPKHNNARKKVQPAPNSSSCCCVVM